MTETKGTYTIDLTADPASVIVFHELRGLIEDAANRLPPTVGHVTGELLDQLRLDLSLAIAATYRVEDAIGRAVPS